MSYLSEELHDEVTSINSIYGDNTLTSLSDGPLSLSLTLPARPNISFRLEFPDLYPDLPPYILGTLNLGDDVVKGEGTYLLELVRDVLGEVYTPGAPCIFDLVEESATRLQQLGLDQSVQGTQSQIAETAGQDHVDSADADISSDSRQSLDDLGSTPPWALSEVVSEKKSVFVARAAAVHSIDEAKRYLGHLLATDKKVAKATHNVTAWRIRGEAGVQYQDCDDDGETAAGGRVLHLLELMGVWDAMVVVTRWYGGVQLGADRFRIINQTARDALVQGGHVPEASKDGNSRKKGRK